MSTKGKKRDKYFARHKKFNKLIDLEYENDQAQRALGYKPLPKPIHDGWNAEYVLRKDVARRDDAAAIKAVVDEYSDTIWHRNLSFMDWNQQERKWVQVVPRFDSLTDYGYFNLKVGMHKWFKRSPFPTVRWGYLEYGYICTIPIYYLEVKKTKAYKTHYKVMDEVLKQEEAEIDGALEDLKFKGISYYGWYHSVPKEYCQGYQRSKRRKEKMECTKIVREGLDSDEAIELKFPNGHRHSAAWDYY